MRLWFLSILAAPLGLIAALQTRPSQIKFTQAGTGAVERSLASKLGDVVSASDYSGADIGVQINTAWAACSNACTVLVPAGTYSYSTKISFPIASNGKAKLICDAGAALTYTGSDHAIEALGSGEAYSNIYVEGCRIIGTSSGLSGIHLRALNKATIVKVKADTFTTGAGLLNEGSNAVDVSASDFVGNKYGIQNVGVVVSAVNYSANVIHVSGGQITSNTTWGVFEDASQAGTVGPNQNNVYSGVHFGSNGTNGVTLSGHAFVQRADSATFRDSYFEYGASNTVPYAITLGDGSNTPRGVVIRGNWFGSVGATATVNNVRSTVVVIDGNIEVAVNANCWLQAAAATGAYIGKNSCGSATPVGGVDSSDTVFFGSGSSFVNAMQPGARGFQFNTISGLDNDMKIRLRNGGTNIVAFDTDSGTQASVSSLGGFRSNGVALANLGTPGNGTMLYCTDCLAGSNPCTAASTGSLAVRQAGAWKCF